jgi:hypothetical protein
MHGLALTLRLTVALVCVWSVAAKVRPGAWRPFEDMLGAVGVHRARVRAVGFLLVAAETAVAVLAPWPVVGVVAAGGASVLFAVLTVGVARAVRAGTTATCRCFGSRGGRLSAVHVTRNALLTAVATLATVLSLAAPGAPDLPGIALATAAAVLLSLLIRYWEDLAAVFVPVRPTVYGRG